MKTPWKNGTGSADSQEQDREAIDSAPSAASKSAAEATTKASKHPSGEADRSVAEALMDCYNG